MRASILSSWVNAIAMTGELVSCDASGSRVGAWPFAAKHLILVAGVNKIVPTLEVALQRILEYAYPLEDAWSKKVNGAPSQIGKCVILSNERQPGRVTMILVNDVLGYWHLIGSARIFCVLCRPLDRNLFVITAILTKSIISNIDTLFALAVESAANGKIKIEMAAKRCKS